MPFREGGGGVFRILFVKEFDVVADGGEYDVAVEDGGFDLADYEHGALAGFGVVLFEKTTAAEEFIFRVCGWRGGCGLGDGGRIGGGGGAGFADIEGDLDDC